MSGTLAVHGEQFKVASRRAQRQDDFRLKAQNVAMSGRPIYDEQAELAVLGCIVNDDALRLKEIGSLHREDFFVPAHQRLFDQICELHGRAESVTLAKLDPGENAGLLADAMAQAVAPRFTCYLAILKRETLRRKAVADAQEAIRVAIEEPEKFLPGKPGGLSALDATDLVNDTSIMEPPVLVSGMLHKGSTLLLGAASKSFKSWSLLDLTLSVASGAAWWNLSCTQGRVLYADFELTPFFWRKRAMEVAEARGLSLDNIRVLNCRGHDATAALLAIEREAQAQPFDLIVLDPLYSFLAGRDENNAGDVGMVMRRLAMLAESTGAALAISHHFSKGNQSAKDAIDRFSGSGVFARFPDALLVMTKHEEDDAFTVDPTVRNFPPMEPFVLRWQHPLMIRDGTLDPAKLKKAPGTFAAKYNVGQIVELLGVESLSFGQIIAKAKDALGMSKATADRLLKQGQEAGTIEKLNLFYRAVSRSHGHETTP